MFLRIEIFGVDRHEVARLLRVAHPPGLRVRHEVLSNHGWRVRPGITLPSLGLGRVYPLFELAPELARQTRLASLYAPLLNMAVFHDAPRGGDAAAPANQTPNLGCLIAP